MPSKGREGSMKEHQNDMLPSTSPTQFRSDAVIFVGELSAVADVINWPRIPELRESEATAKRIIVAGRTGRGAAGHFVRPNSSRAGRGNCER